MVVPGADIASCHHGPAAPLDKGPVGFVWRWPSPLGMGPATLPEEGPGKVSQDRASSSAEPQPAHPKARSQDLFLGLLILKCVFIEAYSVLLT